MSKNYLNNRIMLMIQDNPWMQPYALECLNLHSCKKPYELIERVLLNVSARIGKGWKEIYHAEIHNHALFSELCVAAILIDKGLKQYFKLDDEEVSVILRARLTQIVEYYYDNLRAKR